jgi:hypothetical protein
MKTKTLAILAALTFLLALPLAAQTPQQPVDDPDVQVNVQAQDDEAELSINEDDGDIDVDADLDADNDNEYDDDRELPRTAGPFALLALLGLGGAGSALGVRFARRK